MCNQIAHATPLSPRLNKPRNLALTQKISKISVIYTLVEWLLGFMRLWQFLLNGSIFAVQILWDDGVFRPIWRRAHGKSDWWPCDFDPFVEIANS